MIIYINGRFLTQKVTGVQRYAIELVKALDKLIDEGKIDQESYNFILIGPKNSCELNLKNIPIYKMGKFTGHFWEQLELPFFTKDGVLLSLCNTGPLLKKDQYLTIHDAGVYATPDAYSFCFKLWYRILFKFLGRVAKKIITVSSFSKSELTKYCGIRENKIFVTNLGKEHIFDISKNENIIDEYNLKKRPFIFTVSSMNPNKNFQGIINAIEFMKDIDFDIVVAGGINSKIFNKLQLPNLENVKYIGYISDAELRALYENASAFVFPSFYEGFGLPPLEAMAFGCPVVVSKIASMPEVCNNAVLYCDPYDTKDISAKITKIMTDQELRENLVEKGLQQSGLFTWENCAKSILTIIKEVNI